MSNMKFADVVLALLSIEEITRASDEISLENPRPPFGVKFSSPQKYNILSTSNSADPGELE